MTGVNLPLAISALATLTASHGHGNIGVGVGIGGIIPTCHAFSSSSRQPAKSFFAPSSSLSPSSSSSSLLLQPLQLTQYQKVYPQPSLLLLATANDNNINNENDEITRLRESASRLRKEAEELEAQKKSQSSSGQQVVVGEGGETKKALENAEYLDLDDSCWEITYRFANEPEPRENEKTEVNTNKNIPKRQFFSGKIQLKFKSDGYTDIIIPVNDAASSTTSNNNKLTFQKVWGWDREISNTDNLEYLLFSADVIVPLQQAPNISESNNSGNDYGDPTIKERFYFQARVDKDKSNKNALSLQDGSVTVKRNIQTPSIGGSSGWWGLFQGANQILAEFRSVGEFRCRGIKVDS